MEKHLHFILVCVLSASVSLSALSFDNRYDRDIKKSVKRYWSDYPKHLSWKAQLYQESKLDPNAISPVGAKGLAQFMPLTWKQIARELKFNKNINPYSGYHSIYAGAYYMRKLRNGWSSPRPQEDIHKLAQASYNGGIGNIIKAQKQCGGVLLYDEIIKCLPLITGHHSKETITYVRRIKKWESYLEH